MAIGGMVRVLLPSSGSAPIQNAASVFDLNCSLIGESDVTSMNCSSLVVLKSAGGDVLKGSQIQSYSFGSCTGKYLGNVSEGQRSVLPFSLTKTK